jgi:hypothetical protein
VKLNKIKIICQEIFSYFLPFSIGRKVYHSFLRLSFLFFGAKKRNKRKHGLEKNAGKFALR